MDPSPKPKRKANRVAFWAAAATALIGLALAAAAAVAGAVGFSNAGTALTRKDFATDASAAAFVAGHLPVPLVGSVAVHQLTYDRFTDWRLEALLDFGNASNAAAYLEQARVARQQNVAYCNDADAGHSVSYFLPKFFACGSIQPGVHASELRVECYTR